MGNLIIFAIIAFVAYCILNRKGGNKSEINGSNNTVFQEQPIQQVVTNKNRSIIKGNGNTVVQSSKGGSNVSNINGNGNINAQDNGTEIYIVTDDGEYVNGKKIK